MPRFANRVFLVTGGARGIGRAIVKRLSDEGARVCILDPDRHAGTDAAREYGDHVLYVRGSVASERDVRRAVSTCVRWGKRLDGVVNNAGIADPVVGALEDISLATWKKFIDTNLTGAFLVSKAAVQHLRRANGAIVNISSTRAQQSEPETEPYATTKGGMLALTHALAISLGPKVRVNCISPGWIATDEYGPRDQRKAPKLSRADHAQHPAGRVGKPEDIASLCAWLLSDEAGFVTGENVVIDGGMSRKMIYA
jgi:NAD(P)-dependent dehydrogenase (short-subunit alcohol dehydrogenase family)